MLLIRCGWVGGGHGGGRGGWTSRRQALPAISPQTVVLCSQQTTGMCTNHRIDRDSHRQQSGTKLILISAPSGPTGPVMHQHGYTGSANAICESRPGHL